MENFKKLTAKLGELNQKIDAMKVESKDGNMSLTAFSSYINVRHSLSIKTTCERICIDLRDLDEVLTLHKLLSNYIKLLGAIQ